jgi:alpha-D-ribose 1-methylphosphonate 5-triphosphate synthase subunit PhnG
MDHSELLSTLTQTPAETLKRFADEVLADVARIEVIDNRVGLTMWPMRDPVHGADFFLGEVLIAEARIRIRGEVEGYGACLGRDLEQALGIAVLDGAWRAGIAGARIEAFAVEQARLQDEADAQLLRQVEATRISLETF